MMGNSNFVYDNSTASSLKPISYIASMYNPVYMFLQLLLILFHIILNISPKRLFKSFSRRVYWKTHWVLLQQTLQLIGLIQCSIPFEPQSLLLTSFMNSSFIH
ncbi:uncharacterized protein BX663DRAFT_477529 [Cokeromyces recurvatus]|uniref:uncharacterized protein n=1 Tax=Cokeromyces recurvatus TaxID=90255 RepID=UPI0022202C29|nr:uncharacterized protein BX663DRAFT_477529 [Cokeromyces recurvatus]KAI7899968.1 hypothetical protein BX663DRAFT_477529 [Cokeromyces recurvatus]